MFILPYLFHFVFFSFAFVYIFSLHLCIIKYLSSRNVQYQSTKYIHKCKCFLYFCYCCIQRFPINNTFFLYYYVVNVFFISMYLNFRCFCILQFLCFSIWLLLPCYCRMSTASTIPNMWCGVNFVNEQNEKMVFFPTHSSSCVIA